MVFRPRLAPSLGIVTALVSVCIPCHNAAAYLPAALDSVLAQSHPKVEIIVANDRSTDDCRKILESYGNRGVIGLQVDCGSAAGARNQAASWAKGDYIKFFDADDVMNPQMLAAQVGCLGGETDVVASARWGRFYGDDLTSFKENPEPVWRTLSGQDWLTEAWRDARPMMQPGLFLLPREMWQRAGPWNEDLTLIDDFEFYARLLSLTREIRFTSEAVLYYRSGLESSLSGQKSRRAVESAFKSLLLGTSHLLKQRSDAAARRSCANALQQFVYEFYPEHADLRSRLEHRIQELGGSDLKPSGPPRFEKLAGIVGWKLARRIERWFRG